MVAGQIKQGQTAAAQGDFAKKIAALNQKSLERQAKAEREAARIAEGRVSRKGKFIEARLLAGQAKSGIGLAGATVDALADAAFQFSVDRNLTLRAGQIRARQLIRQGQLGLAQGRFAASVGRQQRTAAFMGAAVTPLAFAGLSAGAGAGSQGFALSSPSATVTRSPTLIHGAGSFQAVGGGGTAIGRAFIGG
jgi:hypothetical protein